MIRKLLFATVLLIGAPAAVAQNGCSVNLEGNDAMKYNLKSIDVPKTCKDFTINLKHTGKMPRNAMGHNVVIGKTADIAVIDKDGVKAGLAKEYIKPGDTRVIAASKVVGGGQSTSVTFPVARISSGGPYSFFCSFPGHSTLMKGSIAVK